MSKEEAISLVLSKYPNHEVEQVTEVDKYFLVTITPKVNLSKSMNDPIIIRPVVCEDGIKAVDKKTKEIFTYNPIVHGLRNIKPKEQRR